MADITLTAANVKPANANTVMGRGTAGAAINAGQAVYLDSTDNKLKLAANTNATTATVVGVALNSAAADQPLAYAISGDVTVNAALTAATVYVLGNAAGTISPSGDLDTSTNTRYGTIVGISTSTTNLRVGINPSGVLNP
jgi:hypothetical protein